MKRSVNPSMKALEEKILFFIMHHDRTRPVSFFDIYTHAEIEFGVNALDRTKRHMFSDRVHNAVNRLQRKGRIYTVGGTFTLFMANPFSEIIDIAKSRN